MELFTAVEEIVLTAFPSGSLENKSFEVSIIRGRRLVPRYGTDTNRAICARNFGAESGQAGPDPTDQLGLSRSLHIGLSIDKMSNSEQFLLPEG